MSKELIERLRNYELSSEYVCATEEAADLIESQVRKIEELKDIIQRPDRKELQVEGKHPAPCAKFCEAAAFCIEIRNLNAEIETVRAELQLAWNTCGDAEKIPP